VTRTDEHLSRLLHAAAPPSDGVDVDDVESRVRRRRTVRESVVAVATSLATIAIVVVAVNLGTGSTPTPPVAPSPTIDLTGTVPWVGTPGSGYQTPTKVPDGTVVTRPCTAADLTATLGGVDGASGHLVHWVELTSTAATACLLEGYPQVTATEPGLPDVAAAQGSYFPATGVPTMRPGEKGHVGVQTDTACTAPSPPPPYHHVAITLPGGGTVSVDVPDGLDTGCSLSVSELSGPAPTTPAPSADPLASLQVALDAPATVAAGDTLVYVARVSNPTGEAISLDRCPSYVQRASGVADLKEDYELNCGPVGQIAAHATVRFEMRLAVPADALSGELDLTWSLAMPDAPTAKTAVTVSPAHGELTAEQRALALRTATTEAWSSPPSGSVAPTGGANDQAAWPSNVDQVSAILTTHADAMQYVGATGGDTTPVLVIRLVGDFSWVTTGPPGHGPATGNVMTIVIDAHTGAITDTGLEPQDPPRPLPDATVLFTR
jgi:hypothetical protein